MNCYKIPEIEGYLRHESMSDSLSYESVKKMSRGKIFKIFQVEVWKWKFFDLDFFLEKLFEFDSVTFGFLYSNQSN